MRATTATATCNRCDWMMTQSGMNALEMAHFLRENLIAHADQAHQESYLPDVEPPAPPPQEVGKIKYEQPQWENDVVQTVLVVR